jgi:serine/threonine-protein kinase RsbT
VRWRTRMTTISSSGELPLKSEHDIVLGRQAVRRMAQELTFSLVDQTKMVTAASELARNAVIYGGGGVLKWAVLIDGSKRGLRLTFQDHGPGIADIKLALTDGWTSGHGLGLGLSGARRLVNDFELDSTVGAGTRVTITRWK